MSDGEDGVHSAMPAGGDHETPTYSDPEVHEMDVDDPSAGAVQVRKSSCRRFLLLKVVLVVMGLLLTFGIIVLIFFNTRGVLAKPQPAAEATLMHFANSTAVYLGNGCFWERHYAYANIELDCTFNPEPTSAPCTPFHRPRENITAKVGYAGGGVNNEQLACYGPEIPGSSYHDLGHTEVTQVELEPGQEQAQFTALLVDYFGSFLKTDNGMSRPDPGDRGKPYRSVLGIPGGMANTALYSIIEKENKFNMLLKEGNGQEDDTFNVVWIMDSSKFPFHRAEQYHQFHSNFMPPAYPNSYVMDLWQLHVDLYHIPPTGCPEKRHY